ncbi:MAG: lysylphosphatidylglycerol synthase domain-containing protein, partial [Pirellulaceae bacterium]|nr:lysylphosphatidylglycerol synthase domain-containing protein [Pirellulaceae bacterium]
GLVAATQTRAFDDRLPVDALTACGLILMALLVGGGLAVWILRKRSIRRYPRAVTRRLIGMTRAMRAFAARPFVAASGLFMCLLLQAAFVSLNVALGHVVGLDLDPRLWFLLWPLAKIIAMAPISFGGIGVREAAFATLVAPFASSELAVAQSLIWQCVLITGGLVCGLSIFMAKRPESGSHD